MNYKTVSERFNIINDYYGYYDYCDYYDYDYYDYDYNFERSILEDKGAL